jgi:pimeloyl-ACP methyl ester carboxylesterase
VEQPETRYAQARDGLSIAYRVVGEGPKDVVFLSELACVDVMWEDPVFAHSLDRLARMGRLICFDPRGLGASDPVPLGALPTIETRYEDFAAVLDAVGSNRATLIGLGFGGGPLVMFFAATYPERTDALVLINTAARALRADDYPLGSRAEQVWKNVDAAKPWWGSGVFSTLAASRADDDSFRRWHGRYERMTMSPTSWRALVQWTILEDRDGPCSRFRTRVR